MRPSKRQLLRWLGFALAVLSGLTHRVRAYNPPPPDPPEVKALAADLIAAPDDNARDHLLAVASPAARDPPNSATR